MKNQSDGFDARSTAAQVVSQVDLSGRRAVVTGGSVGIGRETARALALAGAEVTLAVRHTEDAASVARDLAAEAGGEVRVARLDLSDRGCIDEFVAAWRGPLDVLVNNAGVMALPELVHTKAGWERQYAVNYLGPAELTLRLRDALKAGDQARVVNVASSAHLMSPVDLADPHFESRRYDPWIAYARSKTAAILFTVALAQRWESNGICVNAAHPGKIMTGLMRHLDDHQLALVGAGGQGTAGSEDASRWKTPEEGAATSVLLAASPSVAGVSGYYFENCRKAAFQPHPVPGGTGVAWYAVDPEMAHRLWECTLELLGR